MPLPAFNFWHPVKNREPLERVVVWYLQECIIMILEEFNNFINIYIGYFFLVAIHFEWSFVVRLYLYIDWFIYLVCSSIISCNRSTFAPINRSMISPLLMKTKVGMADTLYLAATVWLCVCACIYIWMWVYARSSIQWRKFVLKCVVRGMIGLGTKRILR